MKKGLILITVILFVLILTLRYVEEKSGRSEKGNIAIQAKKGSEGVSLPKGSEDIGNIDVFVPKDYEGGLTSYDDPITLAEDEKGLEKACENGSVKDIFIAHGKIWGYSIADSRSFNGEESKAIYERLTQYTACRAAALRDINYCNRLPAGLKGVRNVLARRSPQYQCIDTVNYMAFSDYMAGKTKDKTACSLFMSGDILGSVPFSSEVFCNAAEKGLENICSGLKSSISKSLYKECFEMFPRKLSDCNSNKDCMKTYMFYQGIKNKNSKQCPDGYKETCKAYLSKSIKSCRTLALALSKTYCRFLKRVNKVSGNYPGMTDDEIKQFSAQQEIESAEARKLKEEERIQAAKDRKEDERITKEVNERVKKILGKE